MHIDPSHPTAFPKGTLALQSILRIQNPPEYNPTSPSLNAHTARLLKDRSSLLALGALDGKGRPWCTLLSSRPHPQDTEDEGKGVVQVLGSGLVGLRAFVGPRETATGDPVIESLKSKCDGKEKGTSMLVGGLGVDLERRDRVKISGKVVGGGLVEAPRINGEEPGWEMRLGVAIMSSLGNCPKYINKKRLVPSFPRPSVTSTGPVLGPKALALLDKADMFFMSSSHQDESVAVNHRGGPPGFVRVLQNAGSNVEDAETVLIYPEYSGNRLYQTLGNFVETPKAGLVFPDFETGDALFLTGTTDIVSSGEANKLLPRSNLVVKIHVREARFVKNVLSFRGELGERSPYNPTVRYLSSEGRGGPETNGPNSTATMISRTMLTSDIARIRFRIDSPPSERWQAGQYVALDFSDELDNGYSHMRDDDPRSLNDDYIRTFTVSSPSPLSQDRSQQVDRPEDDEFDITIRNVGKVTNFLFKQNVRAALEVSLKGFGGSFSVGQISDNKVTPFIAGGIGITPLLAQLPDMKLQNLRLYWTVSVRDIGLLLDTMQRFPGLGNSSRIFMSGPTEDKPLEDVVLTKLKDADLQRLAFGRITRADLDLEDSQLAGTWYLCTGPQLRKSLLGWLGGRKMIYEDFSY